MPLGTLSVLRWDFVVMGARVGGPAELLKW
jgi:hypothetical protein